MLIVYIDNIVDFDDEVLIELNNGEYVYVTRHHMAELAEAFRYTLVKKEKGT